MLVWIQNPFDNLPSEGFRKQRYWLMAEAFVRAGHQVVYWTSDFSHARKGIRDQGSGIRDQGSGIRVEYVPTIPYLKNISVARICSHRAYAREWMQAVKNLPNHPNGEAPNLPNLIVSSCPTLSAAAAAMKIGRALGVQVVIDVQDAWPETFERLAPKGLRWFARLALTPLRMKARRIYREADLVTGVCDAYRVLTEREDYYRAYLGIETGTPSGEARSYALDEEKPRGPSSKIRLVYAGGLGKTYDLRTLVKTVEANKEMTLDVAGFGTFASDCPRVKFHGALSAADLQKLFPTCDIGVIPMNDASCVGLPNKIFDYAAAGLGIVSSLGGESAALLKKYRCGVTYHPGDVASLTAAIRQVTTFERGASRQMCEREFDAKKIYDAYVARVLADKECL